ncbi:MAG: glyceraldehyde 3-phosphate dehydrogenase NAD-binding domain-containing protein [Candidatus Babeliales bacterium]|jgi:glyceraldehyde 3-phosphate dehydrogenase
MLKVAINGFGRIGRSFLRAYLEDEHAQAHMQIVAINVGPAKKEWVAHLFKHDSFMGTFPKQVSYQDGMLTFQNFQIPLLSQLDPSDIDWAALRVDWVVDASGKFTDRKDAEKHLKSGAKHVIITALAQKPDVTIVLGVNDGIYEEEKHKIVSLASCTANALFPIVKVLNEKFAVQSVITNVIHSYTNRQVLMDVESSDLRRSRAAALNIIPIELTEPCHMHDIYPKYTGPIMGQSTRVPVAKVSLLDVAFTSNKPMTIEAINDAFEKVRDGNMQGILDTSTEPLVSMDYMNSPFSVTIDQSLTSVSGGMGKVFGWFDNESGYSHRIKDFLLKHG